MIAQTSDEVYSENLQNLNGMPGAQANTVSRGVVTSILICTYAICGTAIVAIQFSEDQITKRILDNIHWTVSYIGAAMLAAYGAFHAPARVRSARICFAFALSSYTIGQILWDIQVLIDWNPFPGPSDIFFLGLGAGCLFGLILTFRSIEIRESRDVPLDAVAFAVTVLAFSLAAYLPRRGDMSNLQLAVLILYPLGLLSAGALGIILPLSMRLRLNVRWLLLITTLAINGWLWMEWNIRTLDNTLQDGALFNITFSIIAPLLGLGAMVWDPMAAYDKTLERAYETTLRILPLFLVAFAAITAVLCWTVPGLLFSVRLTITAAAAIVTLLAILRQSILLSERDTLILSQAAAAENEKKFTTLFDNASDAILIMNDRVFLDCNIRCQAMFRATRDQLVNHSPVDFSPEVQPDGTPSTKKAISKITAAIQGQPQLFEWRHMRVDGELFDAEVSLTSLEIGGEIFLQAIVRDVTERRLVEQRLQETAQRLSLATEAARIGTWDWNFETDALIWDEASQRIYGFSGANPGFTMKEWIGALVPEDQHGVREALQQAISNNAPYHSEFRAQMPDGMVKNIEARGKPLCDPSGKVIRLIGVQQDVSAARAAADERERLIRELEAKNQELERFNYTASHDLKSPLVTIKGFLGMLERDIADNDTDSIADDIRRIGSATDKMNNLLDDLLALSRAGRQANPPRLVPMRRIVDETLEILEGVLRAKNVQLNYSGEFPMVWVDAQRLKTVWQNLVENAVKYGRANETPRLEIGARPHADGYAFFVKDNGVGIDTRYHHRIFEQFHKLDSGTEGSGIGLSLVQRIIEAHQGRVWVESEGPGLGSTFWFLVPRPPLGI
ncbi:MAG: PAS domain S-box protein [Spirochaetia bacterium]|nr:PAS domain S-box protein [Spirochaetia bacterium]